ncbi:hypothetical protein RND81_12G231000 [Saponaria officinalis]|uniref:Uncharacterized protein n=1 Tax=Saponaria officinalis TaxID=3572 RepID=A0AAW1HEH3_SAPOF
MERRRSEDSETSSLNRFSLEDHLNSELEINNEKRRKKKKLSRLVKAVVFNCSLLKLQFKKIRKKKRRKHKTSNQEELASNDSDNYSSIQSTSSGTVTPESCSSTSTSFLSANNGDFITPPPPPPQEQQQQNDESSVTICSIKYTVLTMILITLGVLVIFGKSWAILCTLIWLVLAPHCIRRYYSHGKKIDLNLKNLLNSKNKVT